MEKLLVMTVMGPDRPGLVESIAELVTVHGGNWLESRLSHLGGQFAGMLRVLVPAERETELVAALKGLQSQGVEVIARSDTPPGEAGPNRIMTIEIVAQDRPGIVRQISGALASKNVNVEELHTECSSAAMTGEALFKAHARVSIPPSCDVTGLKKELEKIAADLIAEISFTSTPP